MRLEDIEADYASIAELARANHIAVVFSSILPVHNYTPKAQDFFAQRTPEKILALNHWLQDYCAANGLVYLDYFTAMVDDKGMLKRDLAEDGLHPNATGYKIMAPAGGRGDCQGSDGQALIRLIDSPDASIM